MCADPVLAFFDEGGEFFQDAVVVFRNVFERAGGVLL